MVQGTDIHRSSKKTGGVKSFVHHGVNTYEKWILNKPFQAKMVQSMLSLADIDKISSSPRKCSCGHAIRTSEDRVRKISHSLDGRFS